MARRWLFLFAASLLLSGCGGDDDDSQLIKGDTATVYVSEPRHGSSAATAEQVLAGARHALAERQSRAGGLRIRLRVLPATDDAERPWDPALVAENASRAADDPSAIAYVGELDYGATAVSLPITNDAGLLQVSPGDGLTSLTQRAPGRPRAGPERYYPTERRSFVRIGPTDLSEAEALVARLRELGSTRFGLVFDREIYGRELAGQVVERARRGGLRPVATEQYQGDPEQVPEIARALAERRPQAIVVLGVAGRGTVPLLQAIGDVLPGVPLLAASGMLANPELALPDGPSIEALGPTLAPGRAGYEAMRLVLHAVEEGRRDRRRVIAAGLRLGRAIAAPELGLYRLGADGRFERVGAAL